jgi:hypothetical protein
VPIILDRRLQACSTEELTSLARQLFDYWLMKGSMSIDRMPKWWRSDVSRLRDELDRRGVQLTLF